MASNTDESPLVLVENELTADRKYDSWEDVTGERYHFPNQYRNKVTPGKLFIYYRGVRRRDGLRGTPEYFGCGRIGDVWRDTQGGKPTQRNRRKWFCSIDEYMPFSNPVPFKLRDRPIEKIPNNLWSVGVRAISVATYNRILALAGIGATGLHQISITNAPDLPPISDVRAIVAAGETTLLVSKISGKRLVSDEPPGIVTRGRRSRFAALIGRRAEEVVLRHLQATLPRKVIKNLKWVSDMGETPGWDISYSSKAGNVVLIEVKGTTGPKFPHIEVTAQEWESARVHRKNYWLFLVANCISKEPIIQAIQDPFGLYKGGLMRASPLLWRIEL